MLSCENLLRNEVFPAELPPCFGTNTLADHASDAIAAANAFTQKYSIPLKFSGYKTESSRRKFAIPNPYHYCKAVDEIVKNDAQLSTIFKKSNFSLTAPIDRKAKHHQAYAKKSTSIADTKEQIELQYQNNRY